MTGNHLETIKARLRKAYSLSFEEQIRWEKQIEELENKVAELEGQKMFDEEMAFRMLHKFCNKLNDICNEKGYRDDFFNFIRRNHELNKKFAGSFEAMDRAFKDRDMKGIRQAMLRCKNVFGEIEEKYRQQTAGANVLFGGNTEGGKAWRLR